MAIILNIECMWMNYLTVFQISSMKAIFSHQILAFIDFKDYTFFRILNQTYIQILTGEDWNVVMYDGIQAYGGIKVNYNIWDCQY